MRIVQAFTREQTNLRQFREVTERYREANMETVVLNGLYFPFVDLLSTVALAVVLGYGGHLYFQSAITLGTLFAFMLYVQNFFDPVQQLSQLYGTFLSATAALDKIVDVLDQEPELVDRPGAARAAARGGRRRLRGRALRLRRRARGAARARPRGAGRHDRRARRPHRRGQVDDRQAARPLLRPARGADHDRRARPARRDAGVAAPPARDRPAGGVPLRRHGPRQHRLRPARRTAGRTSCAQPRRSAPTTSSSGSKTATRRELQERGTRLSLGQRQLVALARALLADPRILILDEATSSVDIGTERKIERALRTLLAGRTAFVIAHRLSTIRDADLIVVLEHGQVVEQGTHDELMRDRRPLHVALRRLGRRRGLDS